MEKINMSSIKICDKSIKKFEKNMEKIFERDIK
jgi:hypothetical protein